MKRLIKDKRVWVVVFKNEMVKVFSSYWKANLYCNLRFWKGIDHMACYFAHFTVNCFASELEVQKVII